MNDNEKAHKWLLNFMRKQFQHSIDLQFSKQRKEHNNDDDEKPNFYFVRFFL